MAGSGRSKAGSGSRNALVPPSMPGFGPTAAGQVQAASSSFAYSDRSPAGTASKAAFAALSPQSMSPST